MVLFIGVGSLCSPSKNIYQAFKILWILLRRKQMLKKKIITYILQRETDKAQAGSLSNMENQAGIIGIPLNFQHVLFQGNSTIFLRSNITFFLLGYFSICRKCCHHIGIVWPFQRHRMTPNPRGSYLRLFSSVKKCFLDEKAWGRGKLL